MTVVRIAGAALTLLLGLTACGVSEGNYGAKAAKSFCRYYEECSAASFNEYYTSASDCREELEDQLTDDDYYEDCDFDGKNARDCLRAIDEATRSCDYVEFDDEDACLEVWTCGPSPSDSGR